MADLILYMTKVDSELIRDWINSDQNVAWIIKDHQNGREYKWRAVQQIPEILEQDYAIWHMGSGALNIPSGSLGIPDSEIQDPFNGWGQSLETDKATRPWFGANLPGPFDFRFKETGRESDRSIGRSGFSWLANRYAAIGKPAPEGATRWWRNLQRFIKSNSHQIPWPFPNGKGNHKAYALSEAHEKLLQGFHADANP